MNFTKIAIPILLSALLFNSANANDLSIGILGGISKYEIEVQDCPTGVCNVSEDSDTAVGINLSYNFNKNWGVEVGYIDFGTASIRGFTFTGLQLVDFDGEISAAAGYLAGTGTIYFTENLSLTGRLGIAAISADVSAQASIQSQGFVVTAAESEGADDEGVFTGLSLDYSFTEKFSSEIRLDNADGTIAASIGLKVTF